MIKIPVNDKFIITIYVYDDVVNKVIKGPSFSATLAEKMTVPFFNLVFDFLLKCYVEKFEIIVELLAKRNDQVYSNVTMISSNEIAHAPRIVNMALNELQQSIPR